ncbi:uncharacterized protein LOC122574366 [Bombus pyrosoma]|uniref:uncharacterized protein LOC122574366 n=1 Tax=Bombus pyrosoma TaxID=396416 RepID=UPI001CB9D381|nr:uncharacterized protein LOC122574366 [Bombus pyrosoma]
MYRQFLVRPEDRKYQRILWRSASGETETYQLNTVTFGLSAAPYLAIRCLKQLAEDEGHRFPRAAQVLQRDFYVDDALTGAETKNEALILRTELAELLRLAGLNIRKWASNDNELLHGFSAEEINHQQFLGDSQTLKTLGVFWNSSDDSILYSVEIRSISSQVTKRIISSEIAKIYDPLGLLAPVIVRAKMLLQRIWSSKLDWDESLPLDLHTEWTRYYAQLPLLNNIRFQRKAIIESATEIEMHGFCDASKKAYGACVYLRTLNSNGHTWTQLLAAKSKVSKATPFPGSNYAEHSFLRPLCQTYSRPYCIKLLELSTGPTPLLSSTGSIPHLTFSKRSSPTESLKFKRRPVFASGATFLPTTIPRI